MAILELLYNKNLIVRTRRRRPDEYILMNTYRSGGIRRMHIEDEDTVSVQEIREENKKVHSVEHTRLHGEEINKMGGVQGHVWGNFKYEYIWTPTEITPEESAHVERRP